MSAYEKEHTPEASGREERSERDDFWDIDRLLPASKARPMPTARPRPTPEAVEIEVPARAAAEERVSSAPLTVSPGTHYIPPHTAEEGKGEEPILDYHPDGVLLHRVQVFAWASGFHYFDQFAKDAALYAALEAPESATKESFFSYFPQYVQMNRRQGQWYLYWREAIRRGAYLDTDYAYILLYIFELINLDAEGEDDACVRRDAMASVWRAYRRAYPQLDHYMCEWLCDFCLIHGLQAPLDILSPALDAIIEGSRLKEFYLVSVIDTAADEREAKRLATARILLRHCCQYDYRKSKFAEGEHKALFDRTIPAAVAAALPLLFGADGHPPAITMQDSTVTRDAFTGALCSYRYKRKITVAYTSFSRSHDLRFLIGDMVKHVENRLRAWIGVRSRLSVMSLPIPLRDALDAYLNPIAPPKNPPVVKKKEAVRPAYEALYDLPKKPISLSDADAIERGSWETTKILTDAFGGEEAAPAVELSAVSTPVVDTPAPPPIEAAPMPTEEVPSADAASPLAEALGDLLPFLRAALADDREAQRAFAAAHRKMPDAIADEINAITAEVEIFDMVLTDDGSGCYAVIEDYRALLETI